MKTYMSIASIIATLSFSSLVYGTPQDVPQQSPVDWNFVEKERQKAISQALKCDTGKVIATAYLALGTGGTMGGLGGLVRGTYQWQLNAPTRDTILRTAIKSARGGAPLGLLASPFIYNIFYGRDAYVIYGNSDMNSYTKGESASQASAAFTAGSSILGGDLIACSILAGGYGLAIGAGAGAASEAIRSLRTEPTMVQKALRAAIKGGIQKSPTGLAVGLGAGLVGGALHMREDIEDLITGKFRSKNEAQFNPTPSQKPRS